MKGIRCTNTAGRVLLALALVAFVQVAAGSGETTYGSDFSFSGKHPVSETMSFNNAAAYGLGPGFFSSGGNAYIASLVQGDGEGGLNSHFTPSTGSFSSSLYSGSAPGSILGSYAGRTTGVQFANEFSLGEYIEHGWTVYGSSTSASDTSFSTSQSVSLIG
ncbi:MAG: hypothetical protein LUQ25_08825 [Methanoregulaceae archaeon]|nr:hypothetical protein [Methanoregulaceae archaeon]